MTRQMMLALSIVLTLAAPTHASEIDAGGWVEGDDTKASVVVEISLTDGSTVTSPAGSPTLPRPVRRVWVADNTNNQSLAPLCDAGDGPFTGWWYTVTTYNRDAEIIGEPEPVCVPLPDPTAPSVPPPPDVPEPPTIGQIWSAAATQIPAAGIGVSPVTDGVTGLETWLWATSPETVSIATTVEGYTVTGTAYLDGFTFDFGDGAPVDASGGGSEAAPAARHTYETKGPYELAVTSRWRAEYTMTGPGLPTPTPIDIGTAHLRTTRPYRVVEIRSTLVR